MQSIMEFRLSPDAPPPVPRLLDLTLWVAHRNLQSIGEQILCCSTRTVVCATLAAPLLIAYRNSHTGTECSHQLGNSTSASTRLVHITVGWFQACKGSYQLTVCSLSAVMCFQFIEELVDYCSVEGVRAIFGYLEQRVSGLQQHENRYFEFTQPSKRVLQLGLLRLCNQVTPYRDSCLPCHCTDVGPSRPSNFLFAMLTSLSRLAYHAYQVWAEPAGIIEVRCNSACSCTFLHSCNAVFWLSISIYTLCTCDECLVLQLLRRISKTVHPDLAARIMLFQTHVNKPSEASGLNKAGTINRTHPTPIEDVPAVCCPFNGAINEEG